MRRHVMALACLAALGACEGDVHKEIHGHIHVLLNRDDAFVAPALNALVQYQTRALPQIETALHTARPVGRLRLMEALGRVHHVQTIALLQHFALFDADPHVRSLAEATLARWSQSTPSDEVATSAQASLQRLANKRSLGLGPVVREEVKEE